MRIVESCEKCLWERQVKLAEFIGEEGSRASFLKEIREALDNREEDMSAPYLVYLFRRIYEKYSGKVGFPREIKEKYNSLVLSLEKEIESRIVKAQDPLEKSIIYARIGNYIDFGAMNHVEPEVFLKLLEEESNVVLDPNTYREFCRDCEKAGSFLLVCDNCGEIVLDKLFIRQLKKRFPNLGIHVMVRGEDVLNDATMEDALFCGMTEEAAVIPNGNGVAGTVWELLSPQARQVMENADLVLSKGQGNYESLSGYHGPVYYSLLCKCDLFVNRFRVPRLTGMFIKEIR